MRLFSLFGSSSAAMAMVLGASTARAATFTVTKTDDSGPGSLRQAIADAEANAEADTITITATGTIQLETALPAITKELTITGPGAANLTVRRNGATRFAILTLRAPVKVAALTFTNGVGGYSGAGGAIDAQSGSLEVTDVAFTGNGSASPRTEGAAIASHVPLTVKRSSFTDNKGYGAIFASSQGATTITDSTFTNNTGTAIVFPPATGVLTIERCTFTGNSAPQSIGSIQLQGGTAIIRDSTFTNNSGLRGSDFWTYSDGVTFQLTNVTSTSTSSPAILWDHGATVTMRNTILAGSGARCAIGGKSLTQGHNLATDATCNLTDPTDKPSTDPLLGPLADNGGPTQTQALLAGSPAINAGDNKDVSSTDQRGSARVSDGTVDIGAYEFVTGVDAGADAGPEAGREAGTPDASTPDSGSPAVDAGTDGDGGVGPEDPDDSGCGCNAAEGEAPWGSALPAIGTIALLAFARRRRARQSA